MLNVYEHIMHEVLREVKHARELSYDEKHDDDHNVFELLKLVREQLDRASMQSEDGYFVLPAVRRYLVRVAATAVAVIASLDRRQAKKAT